MLIHGTLLGALARWGTSYAPPEERPLIACACRLSVKVRRKQLICCNCKDVGVERVRWGEAFSVGARDISPVVSTSHWSVTIWMLLNSGICMCFADKEPPDCSPVVAIFAVADVIESDFTHEGSIMRARQLHLPMRILCSVCTRLELRVYTRSTNTRNAWESTTGVLLAVLSRKTSF